MALYFGYEKSGSFSVKDGLDMKQNPITNLPAPTQDSEPVTKEYADTHYSNSSTHKGPKGDKGDVGPQGPKGNQGDVGPQGPKGDHGLTGSQGLRGDPGPQGPNGLEDPKVDKGDQGGRGPKGPKGDDGPKGAKGGKGNKGDKGNTGAPGGKGVKGDKGDQGPKGDKGDSGPKGNKGDPGTIPSPIVGKDLSMNGHKITKMGTPTLDSDAATKKYVDDKPRGISRATEDGLYLGLGGGTLQGGVHFLNASKITNLGNPQVATDAANKRYVDSKVTAKGLTQATADVRYLRKSGGNLTGVVDMGTNKVTSLADPTNPNDATNKSWVETHTVGNYLPNSGGALTGVLNMSDNKITNVASTSHGG